MALISEERFEQRRAEHLEREPSKTGMGGAKVLRMHRLAREFRYPETDQYKAVGE